MSRFEPWRLQELILLLNDLIITLRSGKHSEWANVFGHFGHELERLGPATAPDRNELRRLIGNIRLCLTQNRSLSGLVLEGEDAEKKEANNQRFIRLRAELARALDEIEERLTEFVH